MGHVGKTVTQNVVSGSEITDGTVTGSDLASNIEVNGLDMNGTELILDADADSSIHSSTDDQIDFKVGGSDAMHILSTGQIAIGTTTVPASEARMVISGTETTDSSPLIEFVNTDANNDDTLGGFLSLISNDSVAEITARRESSTSNAFLFFGTQPTGGALTERMRILSGGNVVTKNGFFKASSASNKFYNGTDPSSGSWHEFNSTVGNEQILAVTNHNTGTDNEGIVVRHVGNTTNDSSNYLSCGNDVNGNKLRINGNGHINSAPGTISSSSDSRIKTVLGNATDQWEDIKAINFVKYKLHGDDQEMMGVVAQEIEKTSPNLVHSMKPHAFDIKNNAEFGTLYEDGDDIPDGKKVGDIKEIKDMVKVVKTSVIHTKAVKALQEAMARIETLEAKVKALENA